ncbi:hypothetical protein [Streptosporangium sp. NPDC003464]
MHDDHGPAHRRGPGPGPRGRRPYGAPPDPPPEPATSPDGHRADARGPRYGTAGDPFVYGSRINVDIRQVWPPQPPPPPPPARSRRPWPWPQIPRERLLRPALICGFLAAAGVGLWSSGWSPVSRPTTLKAAVPAPSRTAGHDVVVTPSATAPATGHVPHDTPQAVPATPDRRPHGREPAPARAAEHPRRHVIPDIRAGQDGRRHREAGAPKAVRRPAPRTAEPEPPEPPQTSPAPRARRPSPGEETGTGVSADALTTPEPSVTPRTPGPPRTPRPSRTPRIPRTSAIPDTSVVPDSPGDRLSAAYACRHFQQSDWRHGYCTQVWNDYKQRNGLP